MASSQTLLDLEKGVNTGTRKAKTPVPKAKNLEVQALAWAGLADGLQDFRLRAPPATTRAHSLTRKAKSWNGETWASQSRCCCGVTDGEQELGSLRGAGEGGAEGNQAEEAARVLARPKHLEQRRDVSVRAPRAWASPGNPVHKAEL